MHVLVCVIKYVKDVVSVCDAVHSSRCVPYCLRENYIQGGFVE